MRERRPASVVTSSEYQALYAIGACEVAKLCQPGRHEACFVGLHARRGSP